MLERQAATRQLYLARAAILQRSADSADQAFGIKVEAFLRSMPERERLALARKLRSANGSLELERPEPARSRDH